MRTLSRFYLLIACPVMALTSCGDGADSAEKAPPFVPLTKIVIAGATVDIGSPVVLWTDPIGFDAYRKSCVSVARDLPIEASPGSPLERYGKRNPRSSFSAADKARIRKSGFTTDDLIRQITLFVLHYDAVGTSTRCFRALHDRRGLSVHFMLDVDGTIYQTLDVVERALHAGDVNDISVGVEIANIGAMSTPKLLREWYADDANGNVRVVFPDIRNPGKQRLQDQVFRPAREKPVQGVVQGQKFVQYDFTPEQYAALAKLAAGLSRALPSIELRVPSDPAGNVITQSLTEKELDAHRGIIGHLHASKKKYDPGPAFQWSRFLTEARAEKEAQIERSRARSPASAAPNEK